MPDTPPATTGSLMIGLLEGFMWLDRGLQESLRALNLPNVRRLESMIMLYAASGIRQPTDLARTLGVTRQSINSAMRELEQKNLIELKPDPRDGRCKIIEFSRAGDPVRLKAVKIMAALEATLVERLGEQSMRNLATVLGADWGDTPLVEQERKRAKKAVSATR
ncbi:MAG: winged helix-turn-helix transcriptional regulator [Rhodobiaceae bacterium]|nr:winged helix-turn-helix transcriptional regulator [Rhodobiaceae bacterium]